MRRHRTNPKQKFMTCITCVSKRMLENTERIFPHTEPPWRLSEVNFNDRIKLFILENTPGKSIKEDWADAHMELITEEEDNPNILFVYSDGSLTEEKGIRRSGFGAIGYNQGRKVFERKEATGEHSKVFNAEMAGLHAAPTEARIYIENAPINIRPHKIVFYMDNTSSINRIFKDSLAKAQVHSRGLRK